MKFITWWKKHFLMMVDGADGGGAGDGGSSDGAGDGNAGGGDSGGSSKAPQDPPTPPAGDNKAAPPAKPDAKGSEGGYWPDDWRTKASKGDTKLEARFSRYANPEAALTALIAAQNRISSGELKAVLSKDAKPEELKAWRAEQGIPETPDKYDLDLGKDFTIGEEDKPLIEEFLKAAHGTNQTPDQVKASLRAYYAVNEKMSEKRADDDVRIQDESTETLRADWGPEFKRNINLVHNLLDVTCTGDLKDKFLGGRLADGTPIGSSPEALKMLLGLALVNNPAGTVVPNAGGNMSGAVDDEIEKIEKAMRTNRTAYNKDEKMQARYRELIGARETLNKRKVA